ncbi:unnamed protein product [Cuscuta campestris]|uniref:Integrase catalytic domain-containing protein n=1 Tax=Cuscuta campestris TaxID=132261 RepID=A0A484KBD5_9ASTE|nr:unnamed protein product [Cuscuta campestris]
MVASRRVTRSSTANVGGGLKMTVTAPIGAGHDELDISLNDVASQNTTDLRHRIPRRRTTNARVGETSGARTPGPDPSGFWGMMRAMMLNQPMTGFCMPVTMSQLTFQPDRRREVQQNVVGSVELFAQHLKNLMADSCLNPSPEGPKNKEFSRSQQRDKGKGPKRRANKKQASHRDKETVIKRREPLKEGQGESESHVSVFSRMRVPVTKWLYGRRNTFLQNEAGKTRMPCEEQCDRNREVHPERPNSRVEQPVQHPVLRAPRRTPVSMDVGTGRSRDERIDLLLKRLDALEKRSGPGQEAKPMFRLRSPFSERIFRAQLPSSFQMPPIRRYDGTTYPQEHFNRYQTLMNVVTFSEEVLCRSFPATLDGLASEWFNELPERKIESWEDLARRFLVHFAGNRKKKLHFSHLLSVRQRPDEPLREFLARWKLETTRVYGADDQTRLSTFHLVLRSGDFSKRLALEKPIEYSIALAMSEEEAETEELEANKKKEEAGRLGSIAMAMRPTPRKVTIDERPHLLVKNRFRKGRDPHDRRSHGKDVYEEGGEDRRHYPPRGPKLLFLDELTPLTHPVSAILDFAEHQGLVEYDPRFPPICTVGEGPYCRFHRAAGHDTDACKVLKREIENLIHARYLRQFVKKKNTWRKDDRKKSGDNRRKKPAGTQQKKRKEIGLPSDEEEEDDPRQKRIEESRMIYGGNIGGDSAEQRKKWVHSAYVGDVRSAPGPSKVAKTEPLLFGPKDLPEIPSPHRDALVVKCEINEVVIHRSYVDNGSSVNIMYVKTFEELGLKKELLKRVKTPLSGFTGDIIDSEGLIEFMKLARLCYQKQTKNMDAQDLRVDSIATALLKEEEGRPRVEPAEDTKYVVIMEEHQEKKIKLGTNISSEFRSKIIQVLRENFAVFACSVEDMPGVSKSLITHRLAIEADAEPIKQRRRHLSKDRRDFVKKEVDMLQAAGHAEYVRIRLDSRLVVSQIKGEFHTKEERMRLYKEAAPELLKILKGYELVQIPRAENIEADVLSKLSNDDPEHISKMARVEDLGSPSIHVAGQIMEEVHEGVCAALQGPFSMARRIVLQGYFWPTMVKDCAKRAKRCKVCQIFQNIPGRPGTSYHPISSSIPFAHWGIDLIGLMPRAPSNFRWIIVAIDYFTKWIEAEPLITTDNGTQFEAGDFNELLGDWKIRHTYSSVAYPQGNDQVENANRTIMDGIKKRLESYKGAWVDQLPNVLWAYRTTPRRATEETPFSMCYGLEARAPSEVFIPTWRKENCGAKENEETMAADLNFIEERREQAFLKAENYRRQVKEYYDRKVRAREFRVGDLVLRKREASQPTEGGKFAKSYEGPYKVRAVLRPGTYKLSTLEGRELSRHWNTHNLIFFYMFLVGTVSKFEMEAADRVASSDDGFCWTPSPLLRLRANSLALRITSTGFISPAETKQQLEDTKQEKPAETKQQLEATQLLPSFTQARDPQQAIVFAVTSGSRKFFLGTDSAPHDQRKKECPCGCAGIYNAPVALSVYTKVFEDAGTLDKLEAFTSFNGPDFYGLPRNTRRIKLSKTQWKIKRVCKYTSMLHKVTELREDSERQKGMSECRILCN